MNKQYEFIEHTADAKFVAYGNDICNVFENAALAMFEVMLDTASVQPLQSCDIVLSANRLDELLHDWLSELLFLFEVDGIAFSDFNVQSIRMGGKADNGDGGNVWTLSAKASGETLDLQKHGFRAEIKAVTYHDLDVTCDELGCTATVLVDL